MSETDPRLTRHILLGLLAGVVAAVTVLIIGQFAPPVLSGARTLATSVLDPFGQIFLRILFFVVIPLVFASLAAGVAQLENLSHLGPLVGRTFSLFALNMTIAVLLGLLMMNVLRPGDQLSATTKTELMASYGTAADGPAAHPQTSDAISLAKLVDMFMPRNLLGAFVGSNRNALGEVLPLILFAVLTGVAATQLENKKRIQLRDTLDLITDLMTGIVHIALRLAPYAVPALIFSAIVKVGFSLVAALAVFVLGCVTMMCVHLFGTMSVWLKLWTSHRPLDFFWRIRTVLVTAFSTSSSNATLPTALAAVRDDLGVKQSTAGFVLPLGTTMNMSGTALYEGCVVLFVAQVFGVDLSLAQQATLTLLAVLSAVAVAGIPGGSLPLIAGLLVTFNVPPEGIGIILGVDRLLDMARTTVNVGCDVVTCAVVDARTRRA